MIYKEDIEKAMDTLGLPYSYRQFTEEEVVPPPFAVWYLGDSGNFHADDEVYCKINELNVELYTDEKDFDLEEKVEEMLSALGLGWEREEQWIESEKMYEVLFYTEVIYGGYRKEE